MANWRDEIKAKYNNNLVWNSELEEKDEWGTEEDARILCTNAKGRHLLN